MLAGLRAALVDTELAVGTGEPGGALAQVRSVRVEAGSPVEARIDQALVQVVLAAHSSVAGSFAVTNEVIDSVDATATVHAQVRLAVIPVDLAPGSDEPFQTVALV